MDIVCGQVGEPTSVLLRAVVVDGLRVDGPGKLTRALGIVRAMDGWDVCGGGCVWVEDDGVVVEVPLAGPRVGISKSTELALRWVWRG